MQTEKITVNALAAGARAELRERFAEGEARDMVRLMFHAFKGWDVTNLVINGERLASDWLCGKVRDAVKRVLGGEPVQYVVGEAYFYGMDLYVAPGVLIPRPETAELVDLIVEQNKESDLRVLDVGTGSGAIAIALSRCLRFPKVTAIDLSDDALAVARRNADAFKADIDLFKVDIFTYEPAEDSFDIIVSNPPYIAESEKKDMEENVLDHEPHLALFVPDDNPLIYYSRIAEVGRKALAEEGRLYFEINPLYAEDLAKMLESQGYAEVELRRDSHNKVRFATAIKPN